jgi:hypothetical protein
MITINEATLREACLDGCDGADAVAYDSKIGEYYQHLSKTAEPHGIEITFSESDLGTYSYYADTDREHFFWCNSLDFWEWYQTKY